MNPNDVKHRGRPKDLHKRAAILREARKLFFAQGVEAVKIDQIAARAGISKMTVYASFPDKIAIFEAVVALEHSRMAEAVTDLQISTGTIDTVLTGFGSWLMRFLIDPDLLRLDTMLSSEKPKHPDLGRRFFQAGPEQMWQTLTAIIEAGSARGELAAENPKQAAEDLISLWLGLVPLQLRFIDKEPVSDALIGARVDHGVAMFLKLYGPGHQA
jgi:TetR/AcrR family transcriptional regulator, mexJK operon transcriptional repressor